MVAGMLISLDQLRAIYEVLFREGVMLAKKDKRPQSFHSHVPGVTNLQVARAMGSLKARGYVRETFVWRHFYWYLNNEGIIYLRQYLHLPPEIVPASLQRVRRQVVTAAPRRAAGPPQVQRIEGPTSYAPKPSESWGARQERQDYRRKEEVDEANTDGRSLMRASRASNFHRTMENRALRQEPQHYLPKEEESVSMSVSRNSTNTFPMASGNRELREERQDYRLKHDIYTGQEKSVSMATVTKEHAKSSPNAIGQERQEYRQKEEASLRLPKGPVNDASKVSESLESHVLKETYRKPEVIKVHTEEETPGLSKGRANDARKVDESHQLPKSHQKLKTEVIHSDALSTVELSKDPRRYLAKTDDNLDSKEKTKKENIELEVKTASTEKMSKEQTSDVPKMIESKEISKSHKKLTVEEVSVTTESEVKVISVSTAENIKGLKQQTKKPLKTMGKEEAHMATLTSEVVHRGSDTAVRKTDKQQEVKTTQKEEVEEVHAHSTSFAKLDKVSASNLPKTEENLGSKQQTKKKLQKLGKEEANLETVSSEVVLRGPDSDVPKTDKKQEIMKTPQKEEEEVLAHSASIAEWTKVSASSSPTEENLGSKQQKKKNRKKLEKEEAQVETVVIVGVSTEPSGEVPKTEDNKQRLKGEKQELKELNVHMMSTKELSKGQDAITPTTEVIQGSKKLNKKNRNKIENEEAPIDTLSIVGVSSAPDKDVPKTGGSKELREEQKQEVEATCLGTLTTEVIKNTASHLSTTEEDQGSKKKTKKNRKKLEKEEAQVEQVAIAGVQKETLSDVPKTDEHHRHKEIQAKVPQEKPSEEDNLKMVLEEKVSQGPVSDLPKGPESKQKAKKKRGKLETEELQADRTCTPNEVKDPTILPKIQETHNTNQAPDENSQTPNVEETRIEAASIEDMSKGLTSDILQSDERQESSLECLEYHHTVIVEEVHHKTISVDLAITDQKAKTQEYQHINKENLQDKPMPTVSKPTVPVQNNDDLISRPESLEYSEPAESKEVYRETANVVGMSVIASSTVRQTNERRGSEEESNEQVLKVVSLDSPVIAGPTKDVTQSEEALKSPIAVQESSEEEQIEHVHTKTVELLEHTSTTSTVQPNPVSKPEEKETNEDVHIQHVPELRPTVDAPRLEKNVQENKSKEEQVEPLDILDTTAADFKSEETAAPIHEEIPAEMIEGVEPSSEASRLDEKVPQKSLQESFSQEVQTGSVSLVQVGNKAPTKEETLHCTQELQEKFHGEGHTETVTMVVSTREVSKTVKSFQCRLELQDIFQEEENEEVHEETVLAAHSVAPGSEPEPPQNGHEQVHVETIAMVVSSNVASTAEAPELSQKPLMEDQEHEEESVATEGQSEPTPESTPEEGKCCKHLGSMWLTVLPGDVSTAGAIGKLGGGWGGLWAEAGAVEH